MEFYRSVGLIEIFIWMFWFCNFLRVLITVLHYSFPHWFKIYIFFLFQLLPKGIRVWNLLVLNLKSIFSNIKEKWNEGDDWISRMHCLSFGIFFAIEQLLYFNLILWIFVRNLDIYIATVCVSPQGFFVLFFYDFL